jgi:hypothetical protein
VTSPFRIRSDLTRFDLAGFTFPLGVEAAIVRPPLEGYTVTWLEGDEDAPDTYTFHVALSHHRIKPLIAALFDRLPDHVSGILELGSRDAYRIVDVYLSRRAMTLDRFLEGWQCFQPIFLEDATLAVGVNTDEPFMEFFIDQDKRVTIHVQPEARSEIETLLAKHDLHECDEADIIVDEGELERTITRTILVEDDRLLCDVDQLLLALRHDWDLELEVDDQRNLDATGRDLGRTLWHAIVLIDSGGSEIEGVGHAMVWAMARSRQEMTSLLRERLDDEMEWSFGEIYTMDRVAFDDRPEALADLQLRHPRSEVLLLSIETSEGTQTDPRGQMGEHG